MRKRAARAAPGSRRLCIGLRPATLLLAAAWLSGCAGSMRTRITERFLSGKNEHHWTLVRTGTCGAGSTSPTFRDGAQPQSMDEILSGALPGESFRSGSLELTAVSGSRKSPPPHDECSVLLATALVTEDEIVYNGGDIDGDLEAEIDFRLMTPQSVLEVLIVFEAESRYLALFVPVAGRRAQPYTAPGKAAYMRRSYDMEMPNAPVEIGAPVSLKLVYTRERNAVEIMLNGEIMLHPGEVLYGKVLSRRGKDWPVAPNHLKKKFRSPASQLWIYVEAGLDEGVTSTALIDSVRLRGR